MKKSILIIAAAATVLASCTNEKVLNEIQTSSSNPTVIGFSNYNIKPTKSETALEEFHKTFVVYATKMVEGETTPQNVFGAVAADTAVQGTVCTYVSDTLFYDSNWKYEGLRFWDTRAKYDFIAYSPSNAPLLFKYADVNAKVQDAANKFVTSDTVTLYGQNLQDGGQGTNGEKTIGFKESIDSTKKDIDIMISDLVKDQDGRTYVATNPKRHVELEFHHILAKLNIRIAKDQFLDKAEVKIKSVKLEGLKHVGVFDKDQWTAVERDTNSTYTLCFNIEDSAYNYTILPESTYMYFVESLIMPQILPDTCNLTIKYDIKSGSNINDQHTESYTTVKNINSDEIFTAFKDRYNYTLSLIIKPGVITFDSNAAAWDNDVNKDIEDRIN